MKTCDKCGRNLKLKKAAECSLPPILEDVWGSCVEKNNYISAHKRTHPRGPEELLGALGSWGRGSSRDSAQYKEPRNNFKKFDPIG